MAGTFRHVHALVAGLLIGLGAYAQTARMAADAHPRFDVATIRVAEPGSTHTGFRTEGQKVFIDNESVAILMMFAFNVHLKQIVGAPLLEHERFDIRGVMDTPGEPSTKQFQELVRSLLVERFALKVHTEQRELPVYTITEGKSGAKLQPTQNAPMNQDGSGNAHGQTMDFVNNSMDEFALGMQFFTDRPVVNRTALNGRYDFKLQWKPGIAASTDAADYPDLFTAIQQQLGLKLNPVKDTVNVLVVDSVAEPSAN